MTKDEVFGILLGKEMYDTVKAKINADDCYDVVRFIVLNELGIIDDDGNYIVSVIDSIKDEVKEEVIAAICDDEDDDTSATNRSSLILLFNPGRRFLLLGDATCASIRDAMENHDLTKCTIKVPHHGSKHSGAVLPHPAHPRQCHGAALRCVRCPVCRVGHRLHLPDQLHPLRPDRADQ